MADLSDEEQELCQRISRNLKRLMRLRGPGERTSLDAVVRWMKRDVVIQKWRLSDARLRQYVAFQAGYDGYGMEIDSDKRHRGVASPTKTWLVVPREGEVCQ